MSRDRILLLKCVLVMGLFGCSFYLCGASTLESKSDTNENRSRIFSPRMDYDEWTPLGRGDPLKNDPTFDYVPPVLDRVQYWLDSYTTEASTKRDILVLGVTAKKTSPKIPEQFLKFVDSPKFNRNQEPPFRNDFTGSSGAEPPKIVRTTNFRNNIVEYRNQNRIPSSNYYTSQYYDQKIKPYTIMLPPPLVQKHTKDSMQNNFDTPSNDKYNFAEPPTQFSTQTEEGPTLPELQQYNSPPKMYSHQNQHSKVHPLHPSKSKQPLVISQIETIKSYTPTQGLKPKYEATTPTISFEKSNLIYQSTQTLSGGWLGTGSSSAPLSPKKPIQSWGTQLNNRDRYEVDHHISASSNHEVVVGQNANIIVDGESNSNEEVVIGQKENINLLKNPPTGQIDIPVITSSHRAQDNRSNEFTNTSPSFMGLSAPPSSSGGNSNKMHIVVANSPSTLDLEKEKFNKIPVSVVMPINYNDQTESSIMMENLELSVNPSNTTANAVIPNVDKPMQITKPQAFKNSATTSPIMSTPLDSYENYSPQPHIPNRMTSGQNSHSMSQGISSTGHHSRPNPMSVYFTGNMRPPVPAHRPSLPLPGQGPPRLTHMNIPPMNVMSPPPMNTEFAYQRKPSQSFSTSFPDNPVSASTVALHSIRVEDVNNHRRPSFESVTRSPTIQLHSTPPSASFGVKENFGDRITKLQSSSPQKVEKDESYKTKTITKPSMSTTTSTPVPSVKTTTISSLTTDPIFSHYKQPAKPIRGPMYLIIQGHSKVKTYKPTVNKHGVPIGSNELVDNTTTQRTISKFEQFINDNSKAILKEKNEHDNNIRRKDEITLKDKLPKQQLNLLSLVENGLSAFMMPQLPAAEDERHANSVSTIEINGN